jgi:cell division protein FtsL
MTPTWIDILTRIADHPERTPAEDVVTVNHAIRDALSHVSRLQGDREAALVVIERLHRENSDLTQRARAAEARVTLLMRKAMAGDIQESDR